MYMYMERLHFLTSFEAAILSPAPLLCLLRLARAWTARPASVDQELSTDMSIKSCSHLTRARASSWENTSRMIW